MITIRVEQFVISTSIDTVQQQTLGVVLVCGLELASRTLHMR